MKVEFHIKEIVITARQKAIIEKKILKLKRYLKDEPMTIDIYLRDESSREKGGVDQTVELSAIFNENKIFVKETDDRLMRAFVYAYRSFERQMQRIHRKRIDTSHHIDESKVERVLRALKIRR